MKVRLLHVCILFFWALSLVAAPLAVLCLEDEVVLTLNNSAEEESGESDPIGPLNEKLLTSCQLPEFGSWAATRGETPAIRPEAPADFVSDVVLPPPEGGVL